LAQLPTLLRERCAIQESRRLRIRELARLIVWDPRKVKRMSIVTLSRPLATSAVLLTQNRDRKGAGASGR
jgi:hypothetical protein